VRPILFSLFGVPIGSYGVSKALAALVAGWLLVRLFVRRGLNPDDAYTMTFAGAVWGFVGAKAYYLLEELPDLTWHDLGSSGFTWYGEFLAGVAAVLVVARRRGLPLVLVAGLAAAPLSVAYGIGRLGCLLAGDGTYGRPSTLPWAMTSPTGWCRRPLRCNPRRWMRRWSRSPWRGSCGGFRNGANRWWWWRPTW